jgi:hypothetical protein
MVIAPRWRTDRGMVAGCSHDRRGPSMVRGRRKKCKNVVIVKKKKISLEQVELERDLWNSALRTPPPYTPKTTYTRKSKNRFNPFRQEG